MSMMTDGILTDEQIAALTPEQRRDLIRRLEATAQRSDRPDAAGRGYGASGWV